MFRKRFQVVILDLQRRRNEDEFRVSLLIRARKNGQFNDKDNSTLSCTVTMHREPVTSFGAPHVFWMVCEAINMDPKYIFRYVLNLAEGGLVDCPVEVVPP